MDVVSQGGVRRGAFAAYLDIDHGDIEEFFHQRYRKSNPEFIYRSLRSGLLDAGYD
jgi:ribonucleotide reductase alpha subunit